MKGQVVNIAGFEGQSLSHYSTLPLKAARDLDRHRSIKEQTCPCSNKTVVIKAGNALDLAPGL